MEFNITRLGLLLKRHFLGSGKKYLVGIAIGTSVILALEVVSMIGGSAHLSHFYHSAAFVYVIGGIIISSMAFTEINKPETGYQMMTLPASSLEKYVSTWFFTSIVYSLMVIVIATLGGILLYFLGQLGLPVQGEIFDFNFHEMGEAFKQYFVGNIIFLAGAAAFRRWAFFKTMLGFVIVFAFLGIYSLLLIKGFGFAELATSNSPGGEFNINGSSFLSMFDNTEKFTILVNISLTLFFLVLGFFKFKEREL